MTLYTSMPLELVFDGWSGEPAPMIEISRGGATLLLTPVAPGVGRLVRLVVAPLDWYLRTEFAPGTLVYYGTPDPDEKPPLPNGQPSPLMSSPWQL